MSQLEGADNLNDQEKKMIYELIENYTIARNILSKEKIHNACSSQNSQGTPKASNNAKYKRYVY